MVPEALLQNVPAGCLQPVPEQDRRQQEQVALLVGDRLVFVPGARRLDLQQAARIAGGVQFVNQVAGCRAVLDTFPTENAVLALREEVGAKLRGNRCMRSQVGGGVTVPAMHAETTLLHTPERSTFAESDI